MSQLPTDIKELFEETWEKDQADTENHILPGDLGHPDWDHEYLSGNKWYTIDDLPEFF